MADVPPAAATSASRAEVALSVDVLDVVPVLPELPVIDVSAARWEAAVTSCAARPGSVDGVVAYNPAWDALKPQLEVLDRMHAAGIAVMPWTVDDPAERRAMIDAGVDGIITNRPHDLAQALA